ncbi:MAG: 2-oxoglutarate dehydrogenase complex dihydrolipoyllysine-residue succinyltransferase [Agitococcus sp.]|jgi:2-oxoglutarate dehydrogenase E2 component (dihydrolipoamide succinyltransferase)|nr:2-oxoglutarate dehydrogenase complex dihydrolipoyllysine-residue succinyltransferase [Moraxellaceae bacterium]MBP9215882.1 2-oxoglutarate dehydrogenase complex dihydrolipoyllysine-residue succinyltransferase [Agitococcus sp.]MBK7301188.1 2-oxoglutarate dehydrogenase complex dihydrolipoyllysine-residue succinyltransferase [Moraxellaceae bacterium]MBK8327778.1 2-oxoglutarate dehydrogenase complex dihydrolipoyllysine-residue succinyltransferase [Moraxellaceae bacterium]MBK9185118.1 2-oxoglutara
MAIDIKAPQFPESVADGSVAAWHKKVGDKVTRDEVLADIETDKVVLEVVAPADGVLTQIIKGEGEIVLSLETLAIFETGAAALTSAPAAPVAESVAATATTVAAATASDLAPSVRKAVAENQLDAAQIAGTGRGGRITKEDVVSHLSTPAPKAVAAAPLSLAVGERVEKRVPMTRLRAKVAERLLSATQNTAMLTTFNEVNMKPIMEMRKAYGERFEKRHGVRLGFMSFFVKAAVEALKRFPAVNASIDGNDIVYHGYHDVGVAVSSDRGLVVPIVRDAERMNLAEIEKNILEYGKKAKDGKLSIDDITGGTFTISNGGVFGSLLSTPILNQPQTAILGMHKIQERPMAVKGEVVILPMMYLALSYDHRLIDGKEAVSFLVTIKDLVEDPALLLLDL